MGNSVGCDMFATCADAIATRAEVMRGAAAKGLGLFDDQWSVGIWIFSDRLEGARDWRELVPISPLTTGRQAVLSKISETSSRAGMQGT